MKARSPLLRVITSHFSGVVTMICVSAISALVRFWSPLSSRTRTPYASVRRCVKFATTSCTSAFMGATYTILKAERSSATLSPAPAPAPALPAAAASSCSRRCRPSSCRMESTATLVLPAPVGAHSSMLSAEKSAVS